MFELDDDMIDMLLDRLERKVIQYLRNDKTYLKVTKKMNDIIDGNHKLMFFFDNKDEVQLSEEEHEILNEYLALRDQKEEMEKMMFYFCGHDDRMDYKKFLKKIENCENETES